MKTLGTIVILILVALAMQGASLKTKLAPSAQKAGETQFPHQVSIQIDRRHHCGGALISKQHALTAGHCVRDLILSPEPASTKAQRMIVEVGSTRIGAGTKHAIKRISQIRQYRGDTPGDPMFIPNDIAVITLRTPVTESAKVKPIGLPSASSELPVGSSVTISGFGSAQYGGPSSSVLKTSPMRTVSQQECNSYYNRALGKTITSSHICAKLTPGHGTCNGDSGGPLVLNDQGNTIVGVVSGGDGKCGAGNPDVYTKVSHFIPYIQYELNYKANTPEGSSSPALAQNLDGSSSPPGGNFPSYPPNQWNPYPDWGSGQFVDPNTDLLLPGGGVQLIDPLTGLLVDPSGGIQYPPTGLFPGYRSRKAED